ncbi:superinfection immunity protein, partial [bacterium]
RQHKNSLAIFLLNLLLGWTVLGWVVSLVWSVMK